MKYFSLETLIKAVNICRTITHKNQQNRKLSEAFPVKDLSNFHVTITKANSSKVLELVLSAVLSWQYSNLELLPALRTLVNDSFYILKAYFLQEATIWKSAVNKANTSMNYYSQTPAWHQKQETLQTSQQRTYRSVIKAKHSIHHSRNHGK